jgi:arsenite methyltransferase
MADRGGTEIMIVDKKVDLNIYKERDGEDRAAACCVPASKAEEKEPASCCAPSSTCCSNDRVTDASKAVADLDFNEWVSKYHRCPIQITWLLIAEI